MNDVPKDESGRPDPLGQTAAFHTTSWNMVFDAGRTNSAESVAAKEKLFMIYRKPLLVFAIRRGLSIHDAEDAVHGFFAQMLEKSTIAKADRDKGRFRSFLLTSFQNFLIQEWNREHAGKRGGNMNRLSLDEITESGSTPPNLTCVETPETAYERACALALVESALQRLESEYRSAGKGTLFAAMKPFLVFDESKVSSAELGAKIGMTEGTARVTLHRLRQRFHDLFRQTVLQTFENPADLDEELGYIMGILSS